MFASNNKITINLTKTHSKNITQTPQPVKYNHNLFTHVYVQFQRKSKANRFRSRTNQEKKVNSFKLRGKRIERNPQDLQKNVAKYD